MSALAPLRRMLASRLFVRRNEASGVIEIITWWELRRIPYNLTVGAAGIVTVGVILTVAAIASETLGEPLGLPDPPIIAVFAVIAYAIGANVCFTGGWVVEILVRMIWRERVGPFAQISFALGLACSILLTLAPALLFTGLLALRLLLR